MIQMNFFIKQKQIHRLRERTYGCWGEGWRERIVWEFGINIYPLLYLKWINNKVLLYSTGNAAHVMWQSGWEGSLRENGYIHMYG